MESMKSKLKLLIILVSYFSLTLGVYAGKHETKRVNVGETFTVYTTYHSYTQSVLWKWDTGVLELVGNLYATSTSATFKVKKASPMVGVIIQATTYYHRSNTTSSGINRDVDEWTVFATDNSTVSLNPTSISLSPGETTSLRATASNSTYSGEYSWSSTNSNVAYVRDYGSSATIYAQNSGSTTIRVTLDNGKYAECYVSVKSVTPQSASVSSPIYINADDSKALSVSVSPSNATVNSRRWYIAEGADYVSLTTSGTLTGKKPGKATVYCTINGSLNSNEATVYVSEPSFTLISTAPTMDATEVSPFAGMSASFSLALYQGDSYSSICLRNKDTGRKEEGIASINGTKISFMPQQPLSPLTNYQLEIPAYALKNKWGTSYTTSVYINFKTADWEKLELTSSFPSGFYTVGDEIVLKSNVSSAKIYYTLDGSVPTDQSQLYTEPILINQDIKLSAVAICDGYKNSDVFSADYYLSNVSVKRKYPYKEELYKYDDVNPYVTFSNLIEESEMMNSASVIKNGNITVEGEFIVSDSSIYFIPEEPLEIGQSYRIIIPENAIVTQQGEPNDATSWDFSTGDFVTEISAGSHELAAAIKTDGSLLTWGKLYESGNSSDGSYTYKIQTVPTIFINTDVKSVSSGYMHHAVVKTDNSMWMWGRQYCGEFGNSSTIGSAVPVKVADDVKLVSAGGQSTAIIKADGTLWVCGRNDFGQVGDSSVITRASFVHIMDNVASAVSGWCVTYAITQDGDLWAWGRNDKGQLGDGTLIDKWEPVKVLENVAIVNSAKTSCNMAAAIKDDGTLWVWGCNQPFPTEIDNDVISVAVGDSYIEYVKEDGSLWGYGNNDFGQLGDGTTTTISVPTQFVDDAKTIVSGGESTLANKLDGSVWAWGRNYYGVLGDGSIPSAAAYNANPQLIIEGRSSGVLTGVACNRPLVSMLKDTRRVLAIEPIPLNAVYESLEWFSDNEDIVSISERGVMVANSFGETTVTAVMKNKEGESFFATCNVTVVDANSVENLAVTPIQIRVLDQTLYIEGLELGEEVYVYTINGILVKQQVAIDTRLSVPIGQSGLYLVKVGERKVQKVMIR